MSGRTHALVPAALASVFFQGDPFLTLTAALAGLAPDIDEPESVLGRRCWLLALWMKYTFGHRTVSHSLVMVGLVALLGFCVPLTAPVIIALCLGVASHVVLDAYSGGVLLWWPSKTRWVLGRYAVYGVADRVLMVCGVVVTMGMFLVRMQAEMGSLRTGSVLGGQ